MIIIRVFSFNRVRLLIVVSMGNSLIMDNSMGNSIIMDNSIIIVNINTILINKPLTTLIITINSPKTLYYQNSL